MIGQSIGSYHITAKLGAGGMGEVWKARDTKLGRDVALKLLPAAFASDPDRMARFEREARVLASLDHPNIAAIYGLEDSNGVRALVLALIEGPTLAERIAAGPIPLDEAIQIARQIAEAVEYAHERGVIHRDLKPANIKVTSGGMVKVLDFGLAKALDDNPAAGSGSNSPTLTIGATRAGVLLGTAAYMSPEQAKGKQADRRSDIWAFGVVLSEMLTGKPLFTGETAGEVLASVIKEEPKLDMVPLELRGLVSRCLNKDARKRLQAIGEARIVLEDPAPPAPVQRVPAQRARPLPWMIAVGLLAVVLAIVSWIAWRATRPLERPLMRFTNDLGAEVSLASTNGPAVAISPDGLRLAYISRDPNGKTHLSLGLLNNSKSTVLSGTEGSSAPFFSPDSRWIAFFADQKLKKISVEGGSAVTLCEVGQNPRGGFWGEDGNILFSNQRTPLFRVSSSGGATNPATELDKQKREVTNRFAQLLPGGEAFLFTASRDNNVWEDATIQAQSIKTGKRKTLVEGGYFGRYLRGHLIYVHGGTVFAAPMDPKRLELTGPASPVLDDVSAHPVNGFAQLDFTPSGTLAYVAGPSTDVQSLYWLDASGNTELLPAPTAVYLNPRVSPDGTRIAVQVRDNSSANLSVYELAQNRMTRLTFLKSFVGFYATWTPDGKHIVSPIETAELSGPGIYWMRADGAGEPQRLLGGQDLATYSFSPDGKRLAYYRNAPDFGIWTLPLDLADPEHPKAGKPELFLGPKSDLRYPAFSVDGRWIAYASYESGQAEVFVRPFPGPGGKWQISTAGGGFPLWSRNGRELFYLRVGGGGVWVAPFSVQGDVFSPSQPRVWSEKAPAFFAADLMPDGKRFVVATPPSAATSVERQTHVTFLLNFSDELRRRAPVSK